MSATEVTEQDYADAKAECIAALVRMLTAGDALGKPQPLMIADFMATFNQAAEEATA